MSETNEPQPPADEPSEPSDALDGADDTTSADIPTTDAEPAAGAPNDVRAGGESEPTDAPPGAAQTPPPPGDPPPPPPGYAAPPPAGSPMPPQRRVVRSERDRMIGGVAAGLANYLGVDPVLIRIAFVVLAIFGGVGVFAYLIAWVVIPPERPDMPGIARNGSRRGSGVLAVILVVIGCIVLLSTFDNHFFISPALFWAAALIGIGLVLFRQDTRVAQAAGVAPVVPFAGPAAPAPPVPATTAATQPDPWATVPPKPRRPRSMLGRLTLAGILVAFGLAAILDNIGAVSMDPNEYFALAVTGIGIGLLVGAWAGRAYWLILIGALLLPPTFATSYLDDHDVNFRGGMGERLYEFDSISEVQDSYRLGAGTMQLDFSDLELTEPVDVSVSVGAGELWVIVPDDARVSVEGTISAGEVNLFGEQTAYEPSKLNTFEGSNRGAGETGGLLSLDLAMGLGSVNVYEDGAVTFGELPLLRGGPFFRDREGFVFPKQPLVPVPPPVPFDEAEPDPDSEES